MKINVFGSTGEIGSKILYIIYNYFPHIKINLLVANENYSKLINQVKIYQPKKVCLANPNKIKFLKKSLNKKSVEILSKIDLIGYLNTSKSDISILSIDGYEALNYFNSIIKNTKNLGLVNKESVVSAGHLFAKIIKKNNVKIFPLDSEHFSLNSFFNNKKIISYNKIYLTASGGPFLNKKLHLFKNITFKQAINHPKWKMGYKNSIDSATLANKCLELVEAHYLFKIPFNNLDIVIHPESLVHSIIQFNNYTSIMNYFYNDMFIPLYNFLLYTSKNNKIVFQKNFDFNINSNLKFYPVDNNKYPIYNIFKELDKKNPVNLIKFNCGNEYAVNLFKNKMIKFNQIHEIVNKSLSIDFNSTVNDVESIIDYQKSFSVKLRENL